jgi:hypothetical protein
VSAPPPWPPRSPAQQPPPPRPPAPQFQPPRRERDPFDETRPDPVEEPPSEDELRRAARRLQPRDRRFIEALALLSLIPLVLGLQWVEWTRNADKIFGGPEKPTRVAKGTAGTIGDVQWRLERRAEAPPYSKVDPQATQLRLTMLVTPLNAAGVKKINGHGFEYAFRDQDGREWNASADTPDGNTADPRPGVAMRLVVTGVLPRSKAGTVILQIQPDPVGRKPERQASLRFAQ